MTTFDLFVYGTLRSDGGAAHKLEGGELLGAATVRGTLYDIDGRFPALLSYGDGAVHGEVWRCPADLLLRLDHYEGIQDGLFRRIGLEAELHGGGRVPCWAYVAGPNLSRRLTPDRRIASGRYPVAAPPR